MPGTYSFPTTAGAKVIHFPQAPDAKLIISLYGGRSLRSLAYAPFGAARGRALRTCGSALSMAASSSVAGRGAVAPSGLLRSPAPDMADALPVAGRVNPRTMVRWRAGAWRASIASCKTKPQRHRQPRRSGVPRSRGCRRSFARPWMRPSQTAPPSTKSRISSGARAARARARPSAATPRTSAT